MQKKYSQGKALWAITKASFKAIFRQPIAIFFSFLFPVIFILIFGAFGGGGPKKMLLAFEQGIDTSSVLYDSIKVNPNFKIVTYADTATRNNELRRGKLDAVVNIINTSPGADSGRAHYMVQLLSSEASGANVYQLMRSIDYQALKIQLQQVQASRQYTVVPQIVPGKKYRSIDFVLPGQLGFSVLFSTLFGIAFIFFNLREQLVLKRFYASPVNKLNILLGIGFSRLFFQLINVAALILFGHYLLNFTLQHGIVTFFEMLLLSVYMLFLLMGVGLIFSSLAKTDTSLPLLINLFGFPQMLLSGTFFSVEVFPAWLQNLCQLLPLTHFNNAMRKISFEGLHLFDCGLELGVLTIWIIIVYLITYKVMKWE